MRAAYCSMRQLESSLPSMPQNWVTGSNPGALMSSTSELPDCDLDGAVDASSRRMPIMGTTSSLSFSKMGKGAWWNGSSSAEEADEGVVKGADQESVVAPEAVSHTLAVRSRRRDSCWPDADCRVMRPMPMILVATV